MTTRYMMNSKTEKVYILHEETMTQRKDMVEISEAQAQNVMSGKPMMQDLSYADVASVVPDAQKKETPVEAENTVDYLKKKLAVALELLNMSSPEQLPDDLTQGKVIMDDFVPPPAKEAADESPQTGQPDEGDPDIAMLEQIRVEGKGKARIEAYCLEKFGVNVDRRSLLNTLVDQAIELRIAQIDKEKQEPAEAPQETSPAQ